MRRAWSSALGIVAMAALLVGINLFADVRLGNLQLDLTSQQLYTLSAGTRSVIAGLKEPITLRFYYSRALGTRVPSYGAYADRVGEMLREYQRLSHGKIHLEVYDPEPFSTTEDRALAYGLQGVPIDDGGTKVYFGLAGSNLLDDERSIGFFQPDRERFLEYDLTKLVYELSSPAKPVVGVMSSLPLDGDPRAMMMRNPQAGQPWASEMMLRQSFDVQAVPTTAQVIDKDIQVLLVAQAQKLSDATLYAIDQFVMRGGRLMVMVDPLSEAQQFNVNPQTGMPPSDTASDLGKLFKAWGIQYDPKQVVGDLTGAWRVRAAPGDSMGTVDFVAWYDIQHGLNRNDPATASLRQVTVAAPGAISLAPGSTLTLTPLLTTSDKAGPVPLASLATTAPDPGKILADFRPAGGKRVIAARLRGALHSAFTGPPALPAGTSRAPGMPAYIAETAKPANLVVVADSDILADRFWVRMSDFFGQQQATPFSDNGPFVANLIGTLAGGDALIGLRSRGPSLRPFTVVDDMQRQAEARFRQTEQTLQAHLAATQKQLDALRTGGPGGTAGDSHATAVITEQQRTAIDDLRRDAVATRAKLRVVQFELRRNIAALESRLRLFNIVLVPAVLTVLAIGIGLVRSRRRARARA